MNVSVSASAGADSSVTCDVDVDGHLVTVRFAGGEVSLAAGEPGGQVTFTVPLALAAGSAAP